ncbi:MAG: PEP-CTERM sorting domain-containing protein [Candidatus Methylacidiphilales bacterium]|nr:PEP-CTERM sorting domain-containing protein [Candidatus Methylacidiphilales bacterium]
MPVRGAEKAEKEMETSQYRMVLARWGVIAFFLTAGVSPVRALILFNLDNNANQTDPGTGVPWQTVGKVTNAAGTSVSGSAVYLGDGFLLTANHVTVGAGLDHITFDGTTTYPLDQTYFAGQVSRSIGGSVDLKLLRLTSSLPFSGANLLPVGVETTGPATAIGWGVGRNATPLGNATVGWGGDATSAKRWGLNGPEAVVNIGYGNGTYQAIATSNGGDDGAGSAYNPDGLGDSEAALTLYDSGSGLFQNISGNWYLIGIGTAVDVNFTSLYANDTFGVSGSGHGNYYVRVSSYYTGILAAIPEPSTSLLVVFGLAALSRLRCRSRA